MIELLCGFGLGPSEAARQLVPCQVETRQNEVHINSAGINMIIGMDAYGRVKRFSNPGNFDYFDDNGDLGRCLKDPEPGIKYFCVFKSSGMREAPVVIIRSRSTRN